MNQKCHVYQCAMFSFLLFLPRLRHETVKSDPDFIAYVPMLTIYLQLFSGRESPESISSNDIREIDVSAAYSSGGMDASLVLVFWNLASGLQSPLIALLVPVTLVTLRSWYTTLRRCVWTLRPISWLFWTCFESFVTQHVVQIDLFPWRCD